jgi:tetratricopeptide (TPR) repeat protein
VETDRLVRALSSVAAIHYVSADLDPSANDPATLLFAGKADEMERECREKVAKSPDDIDQLLLLVRVLMINKKAHDAKGLALRATVLAPGDANAWATLADSERQLGEYDAAISHAKTALGLDPLKRDALVTLFMGYKNRGDEEAAAKTLARIAALGGL